MSGIKYIDKRLYAARKDYFAGPAHMRSKCNVK